MNVLFMIGNGFDLNLGLPTRFSDFMKEYVKIENPDPIIKKFKEDIDGYFETWADFEKTSGKYTKNFNSYESFLDCLDNFQKEFIVYLKHLSKGFEYYNYVDEVVKMFENSIYNFYEYFTPKSRRCAEKIIKSSVNNSYNYKIISFNYTQIFDEPLSKRSKILSNEILHIHGTTDEDMIIGVDNIEQIANKTFATDEEFTRYFVKRDLNDIAGNMKDEDGQELIFQSDIIVVFGMSIGETDKIWWQRLGRWITDNEKAYLFFVNYDKNWDKSNIRLTSRTRASVLKRFFGMFEHSANDRKALEARIHTEFNTDLFKIDFEELKKSKTVEKKFILT